MLTREDLMAVCPRPRSGQRQVVWDAYAAALSSQAGWELFQSYQVNTPNRLAMFLGAVVAPETGLTVLRESGAYSADGIMRVFGAGRHSSKITRAEAERIAALPVNADGSGPRCEVLFERVYGRGNPAKARELGNTEPGDGWRFRGLGLNQMTGRAAHEAAAAEIGCPVPALASPLNCLHMALIEWDEKDCNAHADKGDVIAVRKLINGGSLKVPVSRINGVPEAQRAYRTALRVITPDDFETPPAGRAVASGEAPPNLWHSTEMQTANGLGGGSTLGIYDGAADAASKTLEAGAWDWWAFLGNLAGSTSFRLGVLALLAAVYFAGKRRWRFYTQGV